MERRDKGEEFILRKKKYHIDEQGSDGYVSLGNAIIKAATDDYEDCLIR